jgi:glycosyltransferase involved in cell wall biosynthesis
MDGGSQDGTTDILRRYDGSIKWVSEKDKGQADAVNKGLERATGEIIGWLNSDDIYYPGAIAAACEAFERHPEADVVYGDANHIDEQDQIIEPYPTEAWNLDRLLATCYLCQPAVFFRRSLVDRFGPLKEELHFCLDYEYWIRLAAAGIRFEWVHQVLAGSRLYKENKTLGFRVQVHKEINDMLRTHIGRVPDRWLMNYAHAVVDEKGIARSATVRFRMQVSGLALLAALRWNRSISSDLGRTTSNWVGGALLDLYRRKFV